MPCFVRCLPRDVSVSRLPSTQRLRGLTVQCSSVLPKEPFLFLKPLSPECNFLPNKGSAHFRILPEHPSPWGLTVAVVDDLEVLHRRLSDPAVEVQDVGLSVVVPDRGLVVQLDQVLHGFVLPF